MLLIILISLFFEIKANFPSTCRMNRDCSIYGPEYVCDIYLRICQNPWDLSKQCLEDYDCPRGYACEEFCKYGLTPRASTSNSTWTPWKPWPPQPYPFCHRRRSNGLKFCKKVDTTRGIRNGHRPNRPPKGSHQPSSKGSCYYDDDCSSASNQMTGCFHPPNRPPPYDPVRPSRGCPDPNYPNHPPPPYPYPPSYQRPRPFEQMGICGPVWAMACMQDSNCPNGFRCKQKYKHSRMQIGTGIGSYDREKECFDTKFCRYGGGGLRQWWDFHRP